MRLSIGPILTLALMLTACGGSDQSANAIPGGRKVADLIAAGSCPLQVVSVAKADDPSAGRFVVNFKNTSDSTVGDIQWGTVALDGAGQPLLDGVSEGSYDGEPIGPGETVEAAFDLAREEADSARVVIRSLAWYTPDPLGGDRPPVPHAWRNPLFDLQLHGAAGVPGRD